jgi:hypothetical protein
MSVAAAKRVVSRAKLLARALEYDEQSVTSEEPVWLPRMVTRLEQRIAGPSTGHEFRMALEQVGRSVARRSGYLVISGATADARGVRDGCTLECLAGKVFEQDNLVKVARCQEDGTEWRRAGTVDSGYFWATCHAVWGQLATGLEVQGREGLDLLGLCEMRDGNGMSGRRSYEYKYLPHALNSLLRAGEPTADLLTAFEEAVPLQTLPAVWHDDQAFAAMLDEACDWHLRETYPGLEYIAGMSLFPSWLFALDRYRAQRVGRSCLPDHPLMVYGKRLLAADFTGPEHPLVSEAKAEYSRRYGDSTVDDFKSQWRTLLDEEQQRSGS